MTHLLTQCRPRASGDLATKIPALRFAQAGTTMITLLTQ